MPEGSERVPECSRMFLAEVWGFQNVLRIFWERSWNFLGIFLEFSGSSLECSGMCENDLGMFQNVLEGLLRFFWTDLGTF